MLRNWVKFGVLPVKPHAAWQYNQTHKKQKYDKKICASAENLLNQHHENETISGEISPALSLQLTETPASQFTRGNNVINDHKTHLSNFQTFKASYKKGRKQQEEKKRKKKKW